jgi:hypothetical protein
MSSSSSSRAQALQDLLGLDDDELVRTLDASALELLSGELDHRPELPILEALLSEAVETQGPSVLRRWVRAKGPDGRRPVDLLTGRDFAAFEDALGDLGDHGFVLRSR